MRRKICVSIEEKISNIKPEIEIIYNKSTTDKDMENGLFDIFGEVKMSEENKGNDWFI